MPLVRALPNVDYDPGMLIRDCKDTDWPAIWTILRTWQTRLRPPIIKAE